MNKSPLGKNPHEHTPTSPAIGEVFGFGKPGITQETFEEGRRILRWIPSEFDNQLSSLAGWKNLASDFSADEVASLEIPQGARSAGSVLSGLEAWPGEKAKILGSIATYQEHVMNEFGAFDTSVTLDSVAVTKEDHSVVVLPPHDLSDDPGVIAGWLTILSEDLELVLHTDPNQRLLVDDFVSGIEEIGSE